MLKQIFKQIYARLFVTPSTLLTKKAFTSFCLALKHTEKVAAVKIDRILLYWMSISLFLKPFYNTGIGCYTRYS